MRPFKPARVNTSLNLAVYLREPSSMIASGQGAPTHLLAALSSSPLHSVKTLYKKKEAKTYFERSLSLDNQGT